MRASLRGAEQASGGARNDALSQVVSQLTANGRGLVYSTYLGGSGADKINSIYVDPATGQVFVAGETSSVPFPGRHPVSTSMPAAASTATPSLIRIRPAPLDAVPSAARVMLSECPVGAPVGRPGSRTASRKGRPTRVRWARDGDQPL